ncbi:MAG TPA: hypothetical protein PKV05_08075 [Bacillota bacterium]|nr:hypothetical protein [Bacillota bacterium]
MRNEGKRRLGLVLYFAGMLALAALMSWLFRHLHLHPWLHAFLVFVSPKIFADIFAALFRINKKRYIFFEDYLRELILFFAVAAVCVLAVAAVQQYLHGIVWLPLLAAAIAMIWR